MPDYSRLALISGLVLVLTGCAEKPTIRHYVVAPETKKIVTTEAVRGQFPRIPFLWKVPSDWRMAANDQFSVVAWTAGPKDPKTEARITLSDLPASAGVASQVSRWRGQIGLPAAEPDELMKGVEEVRISQESGSWVELNGADETILALIVGRPDKMWVLRYKSSRSTADQLRKSFRAFCESFTIENATGG